MLARIKKDAAVDRVQRMKLILKRGDDPEVPAAPAYRPEEVRVFLRTRRDATARGVDHIRRDEVVAREAVPSHQPSDAPTERQTSNAGGRNDSPRCCQTVGLS